MAEVASLESGVMKFAPDALVHLGWSGVAGQARNDASQALNVAMTAQILELGIKAGIRTFVGIGSQAEYARIMGSLTEKLQRARRHFMAKPSLPRPLLFSTVRAGVDPICLASRVFRPMVPGMPCALAHSGTIEALRAGKRPSFTDCLQLWVSSRSRCRTGYRAVVETPTAGGYYNLGCCGCAATPLTLETLRDLIDPSRELGFGELPYRRTR